MKGKGRLTQPTNIYQWETLATNLEEFQQIFVSTHVKRYKALVDLRQAKDEKGISYVGFVK
ncbi:hypothetical protein GIB67_009078 [Kingdonia uniflora]|uniref:Uncharacterized protein n=1 Tax=Kingdonia uniflora TaxID=39325 RepID=A0A7J7MNQ6_9MAGN|nr:hypothetical protein GIB67_009078 [Kingdonia uniflora]